MSEEVILLTWKYFSALNSRINEVRAKMKVMLRLNYFLRVFTYHGVNIFIINSRKDLAKCEVQRIVI